MAKIQINNPRQIINGGAKKYYFKVKGLGGPKGDKGDKGDTGATGPQGPQGNAATVSVGSTTTLPVGYDATVENVGSIYNAVLDFGIPQGPQGPQGAKGDKGDTGAQGETGPRGPQGERGTNATVYVGTTTTTNPGTQARVYNSGTDSNAVLNFEIPRGDVGPQPELVQTTGTSTTKAMSQNATTEALKGKQNTLTTGSNIQISGSTISATDTKYSAGNGITLTGTEFSADTTVLATQTDLTTALAPKLETEVVTTLPTTGDGGKLYLTPKAHTTSTATGNPIEATVTEQAGQLESFQLNGDTFQQSYTGKNLCNYTDAAYPVSKNGVVATLDSDGSITVTGTPNANFIIFVSQDITDLLEDGATYTMSSDSYSEDFYIDLVATRIGGGMSYPANTRSGSASFTVDKSTFSKYTINIQTYTTASWGASSKTITRKFQFEKGSTATSWEKFVGGHPSPSPDYPQQIQTVTGEQAVTVAGKNLLPSTLPKTKGFLDSHGVVYADDPKGEVTYDFLKIEPDTTYTFTIFSTGDEIIDQYWFGIGTYSSPSENDFVSMAYRSGTGTNNYVTFTTPSGANYIRISGRYLKNATEVQLEYGSSSTAYTPYSKQTLPINLGTIELCKLGTYQDYIYKDGDDWKVHKAVGKYQIDGSENWIRQTATDIYYRATDISVPSTTIGYCNYLRVQQAGTTVFAMSNCIRFSGFATDVFISPSSTFADVGAFTTWLGQVKPIVYYPLATPTDTTITDTILIAQLEAIRTASLQNGANTITNTATGSNLAGDMEIGYYGFAPRNRYNKWLWLDINNEYEQIGS